MKIREGGGECLPVPLSVEILKIEHQPNTREYACKKS